MSRKAAVIIIEAIELDTLVADDATASSAWVSASDLLMQILRRQDEEHMAGQPSLPEKS